MIKMMLIAAIVFFAVSVSLHFITECFGFKRGAYDRISKTDIFVFVISLIIFAILKVARIL